METKTEEGRPAPSLDMRVFITGANGFIARAVATRLRELGATVSGMDLEADPSRGVIAGDITEPGDWTEELAGADVVIHTAALLGPAYSLERSRRVNVYGTHQVLRAAISAGVGRFVHFSSIMAYGFGFPDGVDETYPVHVDNDVYTDTKVNSEAVVLAAHAAGEIDVTVVRPGDVWGPGSIWVRVPLAEMAKPTGFPIPDGGNGIFTPVYIDNFVDGLILALANPEQTRGQIFNISDGIGIPCSEYFGRLSRMGGGRVVTMPVRVAAPLASAVGGLIRMFGTHSDLAAGTMYMLNRKGTVSIEKARTVLGYEPLVSFDEGMDRVEEWAMSEGILPDSNLAEVA
ncbi:MAG: NAD(P)-dependent oxidoreductase [Solirubrobacterales bacterium]|nr:NAD(P)-dependent oxidoreductase [Solirubrobacterales bacterium]HRV59223.1 NAD(P)-dependent oxidoreductase [Solirubrobacterales bacterium]